MSSNSNGTGGRTEKSFPRSLLPIAEVLVAAIIGGGIVALLLASRAGGTPAISEQQAVAIAIDRVNSDGVMSLNDYPRDTVAVLDGNTWGVSFPVSLDQPLIWGDTDCSKHVDPADALGILKQQSGVGANQAPACPNVGDPVPTGAAGLCSDPYCLAVPRAGEPHVSVNATDGSVTDVSYTQ